MKENNVTAIVLALAFLCLACLCLTPLISVGGYYLLFSSAETPTLFATSAETATDELPATAEFFPTPTPSPEEPGTSLTISEPPSEAAYSYLKILEDTIVPENDMLDLAQRLQGKQNVPRVIATSADPIAVGTSRVFHVSNVDDNTFAEVTAVLRYAASHTYIWVDRRATYTSEEVQTLGDKFENDIYPNDRNFFGSEWTPGIDGDVHMNILYTRGMGDSVAGYFSTTDEYSVEINSHSNQMDMIYINADTVGLGEEFAASVLAHEFQHAIHWNLDRNEESWINEGAAELAILLNHLETDAAAYNYVNQTDIQLTNWPSGGGDSGEWYGGSFLFMSYFLDRFGSEAMQNLIRHKENGMRSVDSVLTEIGAKDFASDSPLTADMFFSEFAATMLINDSRAGDGRFVYTGYDPDASPDYKQISKCPSGPKTAKVNQYGVDYIQIECAGTFKLFFSGEGSQKIVPADPAEGEFYFWSNRGDESDMTLTREFDLSAASSATLQFSAWYDIEEDWDYGYVEVSTDGGTTWSTLQTGTSTDTSPQGNNYGWGWTGKSNWTEESVDLSAYAGQKVLIRFEYITDAAVNMNGLLIDNVRIPEIGYADGFENGAEGWTANGFVRIENMIPQTYQVLLVRFNGSLVSSIERMALDDRRFGSIPLALQDGETAYLIVIGTTRFTAQQTTYQYEING